ncbi:lysophospholipid acyltransferase family protein [Frankia sp. Cr2]|uniref:lysophospholipid acyltransferase family protein n=1 Tax=Frankia sp. Cr2 TaxID=3073932 RepID=UPI003A101743
MSEARIIPLGSKDGRARTGGGAAARRPRPEGSSDVDRGGGTDLAGDAPVADRSVGEHTTAAARPHPDPVAGRRSASDQANVDRAALDRAASGQHAAVNSASNGGASDGGDSNGGEELTPTQRAAAAGGGGSNPAGDSGMDPASALPSEPLADAGSLEQALAGFLAFLRRRITGDYVVDEHGFDEDLTENVIAPLLRPIYQNYFRVETRGLENVPDTGGALIVANHSGTLPLDAMMTALAIMDHHPAHRHLRMLAADLVFAVPFLAPVARKTGNTLACQPDAERLLASGHLVGVWPEGFKGIGKPFSERYKLQRFGRGGFVSAALRTGVPIIPCTIVGAEEIYPMIGNLRMLARLLGLPYLPITPTFPWFGLLGLLPLPSKWLIEFGEPVDTESLTPAAAEDPMLVFELTDRIRETIQHSLYGLLMQRRSVFF